MRLNRREVLASGAVACLSGCSNIVQNSPEKELQGIQIVNAEEKEIGIDTEVRHQGEVLYQESHNLSQESNPSVEIENKDWLGRRGNHTITINTTTGENKVVETEKVVDSSYSGDCYYVICTVRSESIRVAFEPRDCDK